MLWLPWLLRLPECEVGVEALQMACVQAEQAMAGHAGLGQIIKHACYTRFTLSTVQNCWLMVPRLTDQRQSMRRLNELPGAWFIIAGPQEQNAE